MRIKKNLLTLLTAVSLAATTVNTVSIVNTYATSISVNYNQETFSPVNTKAKIDDNYNYNLSTDVRNTIKYTGKELSNVPLCFTSDMDGEYTLNDGIDYNIISYQKIIPGIPTKDNFTKGRPTEPGYYIIQIEGINNFKGIGRIELRIADITDLSSNLFDLIGLPFKSSNQIKLGLDYYDTETQKAGSIKLAEGKDFTFDGWATENTYLDKHNTINNINWTKDRIHYSGTYYFKITGLNTYKNQTAIFNHYINSCDFHMRPYYNPSTQKYESRFRSDGLIEGNDYSVSYSLASDLNKDNNNYYNKLNMTKKWRPGYPNKSGKYYFLIKNKNDNKCYDIVYAYYKKSVKPQIMKTASLDTTISNKANMFVLCPSKTKEYTIKTAASSNGISITTNLYNDNYDLIKTISINNNETSINVTLEAGKVYFLSSYKWPNDGKEIPCTISINDSYKYKNPKTIVKNNCIYSILKDADKKVGEVAVVGLKKKSVKKVTISNFIKINGKKYKVTRIDYNAFRKNKKITTVKIGSTVESIFAGAFADCKNLKTLTLGKNIKSIDENALFRTKGKKLTINVPKKNKKALKKLVKDAKTNNYVIK